MRHRIFIAINPPEEIKKELISLRDKWLELPCRWTKKDNLHITLAFLGYLSEKELPDILEETREVGQAHSPFLIKLNKICYGPPRKMPPGMIWVEGEKSEELTILQNDLSKRLVNPGASFGTERKTFRPHITLGRIRQWEFRRIEPEERPEINEDISLGFEVNSIEVMESRLKRGGSEYTILESCPLSS